MSEDVLNYTIRTLCLEKEDVLNVYLVGSRLYTPHLVNKNSDYDVIIVLKSLRNDVQACHRKNIDAVLLSKEEFQRRLSTNVIERMCLDLPGENVLKESFRPTGDLCEHEFKNACLIRYEHTLAKAEKFASKGKDTEARKLLIHNIRDYKIAKQILTHGKVETFYNLTEEYNYHDYFELLSVCRSIYET